MPKRFASWSLILGGLLIGILVLWEVILFQEASIPDDLSYTANIVSHDNFYDAEQGAFRGAVLSKTLFSYGVEEVLDDGLLIKNEFDVRRPGGERIFKVSRLYGIDPKTGAHKGNLGDREREGFLFAPRKTNKNSFKYWHINYDQALNMEFVAEEMLYDLPVYRFESYFVADQTANLDHLPGVPDSRGVELDVHLTMWVEPITGRMIHYSDNATAWYYHKATKERIHPWNKFQNKFEELSISRKAFESKEVLRNYRSNHVYIPSMLLLIATLVMLIGYRFRQPLLWRLYLSVGFVAVLGICVSILVYVNLKEKSHFKRESEFEKECELIRSTTAKEIEIWLESLYALKSLMILNPDLSREGFRIFVEDFLTRRQRTQILSWVPRVPRSKATEFERKVSQELERETLIYGIGNKNVGDLDLFPVKYIEPQAKNSSVIGLDLTSEKKRRRALVQGIATNELVTSETIQLVQDNEKIHSVLFALPVLLENDSVQGKDVGGFITAPLRVSELFYKVFKTHSLDSDMRMTVLDEKGKLVHISSNRPFSNVDLRKSTSLQIGNKMWQLNFQANKAFGHFYMNEHQDFFFAIGLILSGMIATALYFFLTDNRKALLRSNLELERELEERQKAEEKLVEIEQFAYIASHDLQEPLRTVKTYIGLIKEEFSEDLTTDTEMFMKTVQGATDRMQQLISDLLEYSKVGKDDNRTIIDCNVLLKDLKSDLSTFIQENNVKLEVDELPIVSGFHSGLKSVFQNLINNGIKFRSPKRKPIIRIAAKSSEKAHIFSISDNGVGIENKHYNKIFVIFNRLHHQNEYPGTGIGLAQCKKIVELHGGRIWVESLPNEGSTFYFTIPKTSHN